MKDTRPDRRPTGRQRVSRSARWAELPAATRAEVDRWINVLASHRGDDEKTLRVLRAAREALPDAITKEASWWRRVLRNAADKEEV